MRWSDADTVWRLLSWAGTGTVLGGTLVLTTAVVLGRTGPGGGTPLHWGLCGGVVLLAVAWMLRGGEQRPFTGYDPRPGEGSGLIRATAVLVLCLASLVALRERPETREPPLREAAEEALIPDVLVDLGAFSQLWYLSALALLAGAAALAIAGRPEPLRPAAGWPRRQTLLAGLVPVVVLVVLAAPTVLERDRFVHTLAEPLTSEAPATLAGAPALHSDEVTWVWEHPEEGSAGEVSVAATDSGTLVIDTRGIWALGDLDGVERWRFQPDGEVLWTEVTPDGERVAVLYRDGSGQEHHQGSLAVLEADTGRLVGDHRIHGKVEELLLTETALVQVEGDGGFTVRPQEPEEESAFRYGPWEGCEQTGAPVVAGSRILVPEECTAQDQERAGEEGTYHRVTGLTELGTRWVDDLELPGPLEGLESAPDGWSVVANYGGDEPGSLAFRGRNGDVTAEDLPAGVVPVNGERLLFTETDEGADQVEYRLRRPVVGEPGGDVPGTEPVENLVFTNQLPEPDSVAAGPELFAGVHTGEDDSVALIVGAWGSETAAIPLDTASEGLAPEGSAFGVALSPNAIVVSGLAAGGRAHVIGVGPLDGS